MAVRPRRTITTSAAVQAARNLRVNTSASAWQRAQTRARIGQDMGAPGNRCNPARRGPAKWREQVEGLTALPFFL